jgi:hypothetical protein
MKNIYVLPTDKPSRLILQGSELLLSKYMEVNEGFSEFNQHIYITSDEEIKSDDWRTDGKEVLQAFKGAWGKWCKIILTTDQDLIKDGVQAIDDEFLEWFVKNPSCEKVEVKRGKMKLNDDGQEYGFPDMSLYKIIIPKEEPKQETLEEAAEKYAKQFDYAEDSSPQLDFIEGAKWQQERMYSEEEVRLMLSESFKASQEGYNITTDEIIEQFKKK